jgi:ETC complex I subunit conserved region
MIQVRISRPSKTAMQSGQAKTHTWLLEGVSPHRKAPDSLMGWVSSKDTLNQIRLSFATLAEATAHAEHNGWQYTVTPPHERRLKLKAYADNFSFHRVH